MIKWLIIFSLLGYKLTFAQSPTNSFKVSIENDSLLKVLRRYIQISEKQGLHKDESVLILRASNLDDPDSAEWFIGAINAVNTDVEKRKKNVPAYVSELDGYPIIIYFNQHPDQFFGYSKAYLEYLDQHVYARLRNKSVQRQLKTGRWKVTFINGKSPIVLGQL